MPPDTAYFHERSKLSSFELVNEMVHFVGTAHELRVRSVDGDLDFAVDQIVESCIDHNVLGSLFKSVLDSDDFESVGIFVAYSLKLPKNLEYFVLI